MVGHRADVAVRTAGRHDHAIGDRTLILEIDGDDILGLIVIETRQQQGFQVRRIRPGLVVEGSISNR